MAMIAGWLWHGFGIGASLQEIEPLKVKVVGWMDCGEGRGKGFGLLGSEGCGKEWRGVEWRGEGWSATWLGSWVCVCVGYWPRGKGWVGMAWDWDRDNSFGRVVVAYLCAVC